MSNSINRRSFLGTSLGVATTGLGVAAAAQLSAAEDKTT